MFQSAGGGAYESEAFMIFLNEKQLCRCVEICSHGRRILWFWK